MNLAEDFYHVVISDEEQYSIWPTYHSVPAGWRTDGPPASREECLRRIDLEWTDLTPKSVRDGLAANRADGNDG